MQAHDCPAYQDRRRAPLNRSDRSNVDTPESPAARRQRYFQFLVIVLGGGAMYPIMYLRQNFEISILEACRIDASQLGELYSIMGVIVTLAYIPSGRIADRFAPRSLLSAALAGTGLLGLWFATFPSFFQLKLIFIGWGITGGLLFWASLIKAVKLLAKPSEQGRFFGILDGGRGLVEALLASIAVGMFRFLSTPADGGGIRLQPVIHLYAFTCIALAVLLFFLLDKETRDTNAAAHADSASALAVDGNIFRDLWTLLRIPQLWLLAGLIMCAHQLFWATYSFSAFLQVNTGMTALAAGSITLTKLWMRPVGGLTVGFLGDALGKERLLIVLFVLVSAAMLVFAQVPLVGRTYVILVLVLVIGYLIYAIKGLYWALLDRCPVPPRLTGLAIGIVSFFGLLPDVTMPLLDGFLSRHFARPESLRIYFTLVGSCGFLGAVLCFWFQRMHAARVERG